MENKTLLTIGVLSQLLDKDFWAIKKSYQRGKYITAVKVDGRVFIDINDPAIPAEARMKYNEQNSSLPGIESETKPALPEIIITNSNSYSTKGIDELNEKERTIALKRAALVTIYYEHLKNAEYGKVLEEKKRFVDLYNGGALKDILKIVGPRDWKTLDRWLNLYNEHNQNYNVLARNYKAPSCSVSKFELDILLKYWLTQNRPKISDAIYMAISELKRKNYQDIKSDITYRRTLEKWRNENYALFIARREGEKALNDKCLPDIIRDTTLLNVGDCLIADGHTLDFEVINPHTGQPKRMTLILFYDWASNMPCGWEIMPSENIRAIAIALRRAIKFIGMIPKVVYLDNGRAFSSNYFNGIDLMQTEIPGLFNRLGIKTMFAWAYHGQSKPIERFFGSFGQLERLMPTYVGNNINNKPARLHRGEKIYRSLYNKIVNVNKFTIFTAHKAIAAWFAEYAERPQKTGHLKGIAPIDVFMKGRGPGVDDDKLLFLMMEELITKPRKSKIHIPKLGVYFAEELFGINYEVKVKYDFIENGSIYVYDKNTGEFICKAESDVKTHPLARHLGNVDDQLLLKKKISTKNALKKQVLGDLKSFLKNTVLPETQTYLENEGILTHDDPILSEPVKKEKISTDKKRSEKDAIATAKLYRKINQQEEDEVINYWPKAAVK